MKKKKYISDILSETEKILELSTKFQQDADQINTKELIEQIRIYHSEIELQNSELKRIAIELDQIKHNYQMIFQEAPVPYVILNYDQTILEYNHAFFDIIKPLKDKRNFLDFTEVIQPNYQDTFYLSIQKLLNSLQTQKFELCFRYHDDKFFVAYSNIINIQKNNKILITLHDITDRIISEKRVQESRQKYKNIAENINEILITLNKDGTISYITKSIQNILGVKPNDITGNNIIKYVYKEDIDKFYLNFHKVIAGTSSVFDIRMKENANYYIWVRMSLNYILIDADEAKIQGLITNINKEKENEILAIENQEKYKALFKQTKDFIVVFDPETKEVIEANNSFINKTGFDYNEKLYVKDFLDEPEEEINNIIQQIFEHKFLEIENHVLFTKNLNRINCDSTCSLINYNNKNRICIVAKDVSDKKELLKEKEKAELVKSSFLSAISHEMRTPLNPILGFTELLINSSDLGKNDLETLKIIKGSAKKLLSLINNIIYLSSVESGGTTIEQKPFSLRKTIENTLINLQKEAQSLGYDLIVNIDTKLPSILIGDSEKISHIIEKITSNAIKFTERSGSKIMIDIKQCSKNTIELTEDDQICIEINIEDQAIGIPEEKLDHIFDIFSQVYSTYDSKYEGTGVGLAIVRSLVKMMNGKINVQSKLNSGSKFTIYLPISFREQVKYDSSEKEKDIIKLLIAEDDYANYILYKSLFNRSNGFISVLAKNGKEALEKFKSENFDLVLMDIKMPHMDGLQATKKIREFERNNIYRKSTPIIGVTAYITGFNKEYAIEAGMNELIYKPFDNKEIINIINSYMRED